MCIRDSIQTTKECVWQEGRSSENEREEYRKRERGYLWLSTREKFSLYRQVDHAINTHNKETEMLSVGDYTTPVSYTHLDVYKRQEPT